MLPMMDEMIKYLAGIKRLKEFIRTMYPVSYSI